MAEATRNTIPNILAKLVFLPSYSPDLNPIEQAFSKVKHVLRKSMARSNRAVEDIIPEILPAISANECQNYFRNAGYASNRDDESHSVKALS